MRVIFDSVWKDGFPFKNENKKDYNFTLLAIHTTRTSKEIPYVIIVIFNFIIRIFK